MINKRLLLSKAMALGINGVDLAKALHIHPSTLSLKLNGKSEFTVREVRVLKDILRLTNKDLIDIFLPETCG